MVERAFYVLSKKVIQYYLETITKGSAFNISFFFTIRVFRILVTKSEG